MCGIGPGQQHWEGFDVSSRLQPKSHILRVSHRLLHPTRHRISQASAKAMLNKMQQVWD